MFSRKFRLPASIQFLQPQFFNSGTFNLKISQNSFAYNRYGFVVGKKIDKRATERNALKRRFRACIEELHPALPQGYDMLFVLKLSAKEQTTEALMNELKKTLEAIRNV